MVLDWQPFAIWWFNQLVARTPFKKFLTKPAKLTKVFDWSSVWIFLRNFSQRSQRSQRSRREERWIEMNEHTLWSLWALWESSYFLQHVESSVFSVISARNHLEIFLTKPAKLTKIVDWSSVWIFLRISHRDRRDRGGKRKKGQVLLPNRCLSIGQNFFPWRAWRLGAIISLLISILTDHCWPMTID